MVFRASIFTICCVTEKWQNGLEQALLGGIGLKDIVEPREASARFVLLANFLKCDWFVSLCIFL